METQICRICELEKPLAEYSYAKQGKKITYMKICKLCNAAKSRLWYANNQQRGKDRTAKWREEHREQHREYSRQYNIDHPKEAKARIDKFFELNPYKRGEYKQDYKAKTIGNGGKVTQGEWEFLIHLCNERCLGCGKTGIKLTRDHIVPITLGGMNIIENLQPLCKSCNSTKGIRIIDLRSARTKQVIEAYVNAKAGRFPESWNKTGDKHKAPEAQV